MMTHGFDRPLYVLPFDHRGSFETGMFGWKGALNPEQPQALIYEPMADGAMRLVGVEFIVLESVWTAKNTGGGVPALEGNLLNYVGAPNRYGLPAFYEIHVWAWEQNPQGSYADWNTRVTCVHQPIN